MPARAASTTVAKLARVGFSNSARTGSSTLRMDRTRAITRVAISECPPSAKKLCLGPIAAPARSSDQMPARISWTGVSSAPGTATGSGGAHLHRRQRPAVDLAGGGPGQSVQRDEDGRQHVLRQPGPQVLPQGVALRQGAGLAGVYGEVGDQGRLARQVPRQDHRPADRGVRLESRLDLPQLDAEAAHLDLVIDPAQEIQAAIGEPTDQVARPVQPRAGGLSERIGNEPLRRQVRTSGVSSGHPGASDEQLAGHADRYGSEAGSTTRMDVLAMPRPIDTGPGSSATSCTVAQTVVSVGP